MLLPLGRVSDCMHLQWVCVVETWIGSHRMTFVLMQLRFQRSGGFPNMSQWRTAWWDVRTLRLGILDVLILSGRKCPNVRWRVVSIAIVPHDQAACG
jgi:hypothetical protein